MQAYVDTPKPTHTQVPASQPAIAKPGRPTFLSRHNPTPGRWVKQFISLHIRVAKRQTYAIGTGILTPYQALSWSPFTGILTPYQALSWSPITGILTPYQARLESPHNVTSKHEQYNQDAANALTATSGSMHMHGLQMQSAYLTNWSPN